MTMKARWQQALMVVLAAAIAAACGDAVQGPGYKGVPLATLKGNLTTAQKTVPSSIRLALAWYPYPRSGGASESQKPVTQPKSILTQDVVYQGSFPLSFTFDVYAPPPASAMSDWSAEHGPENAAMGLLLAYEDGNGNGALDVIPASASPVDTVVGASGGYCSPEAGGVVDEYRVLYVDGEIPEDNFGLPGNRVVAGFNLLRMHLDGETADIEVVGLDTAIAIDLQNDPKLNVLVCDEMFSGTALLTGVMCGIRVADPAPQGVSASATVDWLDGVATVAVDVSETHCVADEDGGMTCGSGPRIDGTVRLGGTAIPLDGYRFSLVDSSGGLVLPGGQYTLDVEIPNGDPIALSFKMPGEFTITSPSRDAQLSSTQEVAVTWTASADVDMYEVSSGVDSAGPSMMAPPDHTSAMLPAVGATGAGVVLVRATNQTGDQSWIMASVAHTVPVTFTP